MREKIAPREFWNRRSQHYDEQSGAAYADAYRKTAECIRPYLTPNDRVLDFACGTGLVTLPVAQMAAEVCAIDISDEMVRHLKEKIAEQGVGNVSVSCMDLFDDSLRPGSFDAVVACNVLLYLENRAEVLARIRELLRPEGMFLSATDCLGERLTREGVRKWWRSHTGEMPYVSFDRMHTLEASIAAAGFEVLETENLFPAPPNLFVSKKKVNEHRSADRWPALLLRSDEVFVDDGDPAQQRGDRRGDREHKDREQRHGEKGVAEEGVDAEML